MSYIALARKWRPQTFAQLVGQNHITTPLMNALKQQRLHHAYLFTGTRGVGKTSVARLLAKTFNCEQGIVAEPCLQCETCQAIEQGQYIDLIEVDGASRTRVEDTRDLLDNVQYLPTTGRFKIYLIDEVHMLSQHSFNALLKTLEEPPSHVKFLLATTDPQKLPVTVLSRCLQFHLKPITEVIIAEQLQMILQAEGLMSENDAIQLLARSADGSMRDALSLLDQAIAHCDTTLTTEVVKSMLGITRYDYALALLQALATQNVQQLFTLSQQIAREGGQFRYVLDEMLRYLHQINLHQHLKSSLELIEPIPAIKLLSTQLSPEDTQLFYQIGLKGCEELGLAPTLSIGFEMTLLRMHTFKLAPIQPPPVLSQQEPQQQASVMNIETMTSTHLTESDAAGRIPFQDQENNTVAQAEAEIIPAPARAPLKWEAIVSQLKLNGLVLTAAENAQWVNKTDTEIKLCANKAHQSLFTPTVIARLEQALSNYYQEKLRLVMAYQEQITASPAQQKQQEQNQNQQAAALALQEDPFFQQLQQEFSAELVKNSIALIKDSL